MANQSPDRRAVLEMLAKAAIASQFPGFSRWVFAAEHQHAADAPVQARPASYKPLFFTRPEYQTLETLTELIIPRDETPGARDAGVSEFIDFMAAHGDKDIRKPMREGLRWLNTKAKSTNGDVFVNLSPDQQTAILQTVAYRHQALPENVAGRKFFQLIRCYTVMGYYTSRIGLEELDYPGLRFYSRSPACPHADDPEHLHLPSPRA